MRTRIPAIGVVVAIAAAAMVLGASVRGQEPMRPDVMDTLLVEVRALRVAIEQMASSSARAQLTMGRLQIQEQRFNTLSRQLFELQQAVSAAERLQAENQAQLADLESVLPDTSDAGERQAISERVRQLKTMVAAGLSGLQKLQADEAELSTAVAAEQGRWTDLNQQLDAIDQALRR